MRAGRPSGRGGAAWQARAVLSRLAGLVAAVGLVVVVGGAMAADAPALAPSAAAAAALPAAPASAPASAPTPTPAPSATSAPAEQPVQPLQSAPSAPSAPDAPAAPAPTAPATTAPPRPPLPGVSIVQHEPRAYGWFVGDVIERHLVVTAPEGARIDADSLPKLQRQGQFLEVRSVQVHSRGSRHELRIAYQVFLAPPQVRTLEIAPFTLRLRRGDQQAEQRVEAWPVTVAPLVPEAVAERSGLGPLQPDAPLPQRASRAGWQRLGLLGLLALPALAYLAWAWVLGPWLAARRRPFHAAWRQIQALGGQGEAERAQAWRALHQALDAHTGQAVFARDLPAWLAARPAAAPLAGALQQFFARSQQIFFEAGPGQAAAVQPAADLAQLRRLAQALRALERGAALGTLRANAAPGPVDVHQAAPAAAARHGGPP